MCSNGDMSASLLLVVWSWDLYLETCFPEALESELDGTSLSLSDSDSASPLKYFFAEDPFGLCGVR